MKFAVDTNRYTDLMNGIPEAAERFRASTHVYLPLFVVGELRAEFAAGTRGAANERALTTILGRESVSLLLPDDQTTFAYANLALFLRRQGKAIPNNDLWIAALCHQHTLPLYTRDQHFDLLPMIARI